MLLRLPFLTPETKFSEQNGAKVKSMRIELQVNFHHFRLIPLLLKNGPCPGENYSDYQLIHIFLDSTDNRFLGLYPFFHPHGQL